MGRSIGILGNPQENNSQLVEIHDLEDEQPNQLKVGENAEEELEEIEEEFYNTRVKHETTMENLHDFFTTWLDNLI